MELREREALRLEGIHCWRLHDRIPKARVITDADVIGHNKDDVGPIGRRDIAVKR